MTATSILNRPPKDKYVLDRQRVKVNGDLLGWLPQKILPGVPGFPRLVPFKLNDITYDKTRKGREMLVVYGENFIGKMFGNFYYRDRYAGMTGKRFCALATKEVSPGVYFLQDIWLGNCDAKFIYFSTDYGNNKIAKTINSLLENKSVRDILTDVPSTPPLPKWLNIIEDTHWASTDRRKDFLKYVALAQKILAMEFLSGEDEAAHSVPGEVADRAKQLLDNLPVTLTPPQKNAAEQILSDIVEPKQTYRIVLGDVGAGKGFLSYAVLAALQVAAKEKGEPFYGVLYAPRLLLARQHHKRLAAWVKHLGGEDDDLPVYNPRVMPSSGLVVGTQRLIGKIEKHPPQLLWVDEPQYLGVEQFFFPTHLVLSTATPLPRWVALSKRIRKSFISRPIEHKVNLQPVWTWTPKREGLHIVCQLLNSSAGTMVLLPSRISRRVAYPSATEFYQDLLQRCGNQYPLLYLDGKSRDAEKNAIMDVWRELEKRGEPYAIVATRVVEAGLDIPTLREAVIIGAEVLGAIGTYQAAGRVGRAGQDGEVWLISSSRKVREWSSLKSMWHVMAIERKRGVGNFMDKKQSGRIYWPHKDVKLTEEEIALLEGIAEDILAWPEDKRRAWFNGVLPIVRAYLKLAPDDLDNFLKSL